MTLTIMVAIVVFFPNYCGFIRPTARQIRAAKEFYRLKFERNVNV